MCPSPFGTSILEPCFYLSNEFEINKLSSRKKLDELSNFLFKSFEIDSGNRLVSGAEEINLIEFGFGGTDLNDCIQAQWNLSKLSGYKRFTEPKTICSIISVFLGKREEISQNQNQKCKFP